MDEQPIGEQTIVNTNWWMNKWSSKKNRLEIKKERWMDAYMCGRTYAYFNFQIRYV